MIERKEDCIQRLQKLVPDFKRALFGTRSEKANPEQFELALEDIETAMAAVHAEDEAPDPPASPTAKPRKTNRGSLPKHLPHIEEVIAPDSTICGCGAERQLIGEDVSERFDIIPAQFRVIVTRRPKYACRSCTNGVVQAPAPARLIPDGMPAEATVAHVLVSKYADHLPLYLQAQIYSRQGIDLKRSTNCSWMKRVRQFLPPLSSPQAATAGQRANAKPKLDTSGRWPATTERGVPGRSGQYADDILKGLSGILQVHGYAGYNHLLKRADDSVASAYCWAQARRKLHKVAQSGTAPLAEEGLKQIATLYRIEKDIRGLNAEARQATRQDRSAPLIAASETWLTANRNRVSAKAPLGEALKYIAKYWDGLCLFLADGRIEMDNNVVELRFEVFRLTAFRVLGASQAAARRHDPARLWRDAAIVIMLRSLKMSGMAQAVGDFIGQGHLHSMQPSPCSHNCSRRKWPNGRCVPLPAK